MIAASRRSLFLTACVSVALVAALVVSGFLIRGFVATAFATAESVHEARYLAQDVLTLQLDEETGIRGFAATGDRSFLQPYLGAEKPLAGELLQLNVALQRLHLVAAAQVVADVQKTSHAWAQRVAVPIIQNPHAPGVQKLGKQLMDHDRADFGAIDAALQTRETAVALEVRESIDRINLVVGIFAVLLVLAVGGFANQQVQTTARLAEQERVAEEERRRRAALTAAYEAEKRIADTLQDAFIQRPLPMSESLRFSASYVAATQDTKVGGDWYDALVLSGKRVLFAIGDVTGHGIEAAVTMNRARQSLISAALEDPDPASVLSRANGEIARFDTRLVTALVGIADAYTYEFVYAAAGHPPPVLIEPGREPRMLDCGSVPLGAYADAKYRTVRIQSVPGAMLVIYTDGAIEHSRNAIEGEELLLKAVADARHHTDVASRIHKTIFTGRPVGDDVAILTIGFAESGARGFDVSADSVQTAFAGRIGGSRADAPSLEPSRMERQVGRHPWWERRAS
jgi:CHASE3 domain sensor protein